MNHFADMENKKLTIIYPIQWYGLDCEFIVGQKLSGSRLNRSMRENLFVPESEYKVVEIYNEDVGCITEFLPETMMIRVTLEDGIKLQIDSEELAGEIFDPYRKKMSDYKLEITLEHIPPPVELKSFQTKKSWWRRIVNT